MDSLTQVVLGSTVAALAAPAQYRRTALLAGAALGTLPDLDVFWFKFSHNDIITTVTWHRGPSHSLIVLAVFGWLLWMVLKRFNTHVRDDPISWLWAIWLSLLTHPLLDAFTAYGTQLLWPLQMPPVMWSSIFIIDPLYTLPLLAGVIAAWFICSKKNMTSSDSNKITYKLKSQRWLIAGLLLSSTYLIWSVSAKLWVEQIATRSLVSLNLENAPRFSAPTPFNTLLWRVIVMTPDGYYIGDRSLIADSGAMHFVFYKNDMDAFAQLPPSQELQRLLWFTHGFVGIKAQGQGTDQEQLVVSDLRMGLEPNYIFHYLVANKDVHSNWQAVATIERFPQSGITNYKKAFAWILWRIWNEGKYE